MSVISARNALGRLFLLTVISLLSQWTSQARASGSPETALKPTTSAAIAKWASTSSVELVIPLEDELSMEEVQLFISKAKKISRNGRHYALIETFTEKSSAIVAGRSIQDSLPWTLFILVDPELSRARALKHNTVIQPADLAARISDQKGLNQSEKSKRSSPTADLQNNLNRKQTNGNTRIGKASLLGGLIRLEPWQKYLHPGDGTASIADSSIATAISSTIAPANEKSDLKQIHVSLDQSVGNLDQQQSSSLNQRPSLPDVEEIHDNNEPEIYQEKKIDKKLDLFAPSAAAARRQSSPEGRQPTNLGLSAELSDHQIANIDHHPGFTAVSAVEGARSEAQQFSNSDWIEAAHRFQSDPSDSKKATLEELALHSNPRSYRTDLNYLIVEVSDPKQFQTLSSAFSCADLRSQNGRYYCQISVYRGTSIGELLLRKQALQLLALGFVPRIYFGKTKSTNILEESVAALKTPLMAA